MVDAQVAEILADAFSELRSGLQSDGYDMVTEIDDGGERISVTVVAMEDACEECLVPKEMMTSILRGSLPEALQTHMLEVKYPAE